jgi:hypothetical protein
MFQKFAEIVAFLGLASGIFVLEGELKEHIPPRVAESSQIHEVLYLPKKESLDAIHFGYRNAVADILWFFTIDYFGRHYRGDHNYHWLYNFCDAVTTLDPGALHVYEFCAMMLAWEQKEPDQAIALLSKAVQQFPDLWKVPYLRGMMFLYFKKDIDSARRDIIASSLLPDVHPTVKLLSVKLRIQKEATESDVIAIESLIETTKDETTKAILKKRLKVARRKLSSEKEALSHE